MIHGSFKVVYKQVLSGFNRVLRTLQFSLQGFFYLTVFQLRFKEDSGVFQLSLERDFKNVSTVFHGSFNIVSKVFQKSFKTIFKVF